METSKYDKNLTMSLSSALEKVALHDLPPIDAGESIYTQAVGLVMKRDGSKNFALIRKNIKGEDEVYADFGHVCTISAVLEVYPYEFLDERFMPVRDMDDEGKKMTRAEKLKAIMGLLDSGELPFEYTKERIQKMKVAEMNGLLIGVGCLRQRKAEAMKRKAEAIDKATKEKIKEEDKMIDEARNSLKKGLIPQDIIDANEGNNNDNEENNGQD